jgi:hypothetical protein
MPRLVAHFDVEIPGQCLVAWPGDRAPSFGRVINQFDVDINLLTHNHWRVKHQSEQNWTRGLRAALVKVSREEVELPPAVHPDEQGQLDYSIQSEYFGRRTTEFGDTAREAVNRMIRFFRYFLKTPFLEEIPPGHQSFRNARWTDEYDKIVGKAGIEIVAERVPGLYGELGVKKLTPDVAESLQRFLGQPTPAPLFEQLLSDAQTAWFDGNLRRSVIELAIACEVLVKRSFFAGDSPAGAAFDYLEDKAQLTVRVLDLLDRVSLEAFGKSFRADCPDEYKNIDHLFRCRNKVVHRGELSYRDDGGTRVRVDVAEVAKWWNAVRILVEWLSPAAELESSGT